LKAQFFDNAKEATEVSKQTKTFLTLIQTALHFKSKRAIESVKVVEIYKILSDDGKEMEIYDADESLNLKK